MQKLKQITLQDFVYTTFSIISYLRDFFSESCYESTTVCGIPIKLLKNTSDHNSNLFRAWIEKGIFDAIQKKYLKTIIIGIYLKKSKIIETYTFEIKYNESEKEYGTESITKLIKTLCLLVQSLQPLPRVKHVTVRLTYYEHVPINYEPPFFKMAVDENVEYVSEPLKLDVGIANVGNEEALMRIHTLFDYSNKNAEFIEQCKKEDKENKINDIKCFEEDNEDKKNENEDLKFKKVDKENKKNEIDDLKFIKENEKDNLKCKKEVKEKDYLNDKYNVKYEKELKKYKVDTKKEKNTKTDSKNFENDKNVEDEINKQNNILNKSYHNSFKKFEKKKDEKSQNAFEKTNCLCNVNLSDGDMIQCDKCLSWLHTVCCGFFSNQDKRIPKEDYVCELCKNEGNIDLITKLAKYRRMLSVIFNEGFTDENSLSTRLGFSIPCTKKILHKFFEEGFVVKNNNEFIVVKDSCNKMKIKQYFSLQIKGEKTSSPIKDIKCVRFE